MAIFNRSGNGFNIPSYSGYDCLVNGDLVAAQEGFEDQLAIIESIHTMDMEEINMENDIKVLRESGGDEIKIETRMQEFVTVTEGAMSSVWEKIKAFFSKMWGKLKQFFASVIRFFDGLFKSGKEFATKYEKELRRLSLSGYKHKMFNYTELDSNNHVSNGIEVAMNVVDQTGALKSFSSEADAKKCLEDMEENKEEIINKVRGTFIGGGSKDNEDYKKGLFSHFRSGAKDSEDIEEQSVNIGNIITALMSDKFSKMAADSEKSAEKSFTTVLKEITGYEKEFGKSVDDKNKSEDKRKLASVQISIMQKYSTLFSEAKNIALEYFGAWKHAITERESVYKQVCVSAFRYKEDKK